MMTITSTGQIDPTFAADQYQRREPAKNLHEAAEYFEAMFLNQMLKQSRQANLAEDIFGNKGSETYTSLLDQERSEQLASTINLGIADALVRQFGADDER